MAIGGNKEKSQKNAEYFVEFPEDVEVETGAMIHMKESEEDLLAISMVAGMSLKKRICEEANSNQEKDLIESEGKK